MPLGSHRTHIHLLATRRLQDAEGFWEPVPGIGLALLAQHQSYPAGDRVASSEEAKSGSAGAGRAACPLSSHSAEAVKQTLPELLRIASEASERPLPMARPVARPRPPLRENMEAPRSILARRSPDDRRCFTSAKQSVLPFFFLNSCLSWLPRAAGSHLVHASLRGDPEWNGRLLPHSGGPPTKPIIAPTGRARVACPLQGGNLGLDANGKQLFFPRHRTSLA